MESADVCRSENACQFRVLPEGRGLPCPPCFGGEIDLRMERHTQTDGRIFLSSDISETLHQLRVSSGCETECLRPLRERPCEDRCPGVLAERMPRVGRQSDRDAESRRGGEPLQLVLPRRDLAPGGRGTQQIEVRHVLDLDELARARGAEDRVRLVEVADRDHRVEEQPGLLHDGHLIEEQLHALIDRQTRVEPWSSGDDIGVRHGHLTPLMR